MLIHDDVLRSLGVPELVETWFQTSPVTDEWDYFWRTTDGRKGVLSVVPDMAHPTADWLTRLGQLLAKDIRRSAPVAPGPAKGLKRWGPRQRPEWGRHFPKRQAVVWVRL